MKMNPPPSYYAMEDTQEPNPAYAGPFTDQEAARAFIDIYHRSNTTPKVFNIIKETITREIEP